MQPLLTPDQHITIGEKTYVVEIKDQKKVIENLLAYGVIKQSKGTDLPRTLSMISNSF